MLQRKTAPEPTEAGPALPLIADLQRIVNELELGDERTAAQAAVNLLAVTFRDHPSAVLKAMERID